MRHRNVELGKKNIMLLPHEWGYPVDLPVYLFCSHVRVYRFDDQWYMYGTYAVIFVSVIFSLFFGPLPGPDCTALPRLEIVPIGRKSENRKPISHQPWVNSLMMSTKIFTYLVGRVKSSSRSIESDATSVCSACFIIYIYIYTYICPRA